MRNSRNLNSLKKTRALLILVFAFIGIVNCAHAQQNNREDLQRYMRRAQTAYKEGEFKDALAEYKMALVISPQYPELFKSIANVYEKLGGTFYLDSAMIYYKRYLQLAPNANDSVSRAIQERIFDIEYWRRKSAEKDAILDDLCGIWVATDNLQIVRKKKKRDNLTFCTHTKTNRLSFRSDFIFDFSEIKNKGLYEVTILPTSRYYSESIINETVHIALQKDASFNFTIENKEVYVQNQSKNDFLRMGANMLGNAVGGKAGELLAGAFNTGINVMQENDIPTVTQTGYTFALKYTDGKLEGLVHIVKNFQSAKKQKALKNNITIINFVKTTQKDGYTEFNEEMKKVIENKPDVIFLPKTSVVKNQFVGERRFKTDKWGNKVLNAEVRNKLSKVNSQWANCYKKAQNLKLTGMILTIGTFGGLSFIGAPMWATGSKRTVKIIDAYNNQINYQPKCDSISK